MNIREVVQSDIEESIKNCGFDLVVPINVAYPADSSFGDYTSNWPLQAAPELKQSPLDIARKIEANFVKSEVYETPAVAAPGFLNFHLKTDFLAKHLRLAVAEGEKFGSGNLGQGKKAVVEFSSPNIAKPMHVGHLRNTNIGQAISNILSYNSYQTITDNHVGDWGTQFGKLLYAYKSWGREIQNPSIKDLLGLYIRFHSEAASTRELEALARQEFKKLEEGDRENRELWEKFRQTSLLEFDRVYQDLGVKFTYQHGESFYEKDLPKIVSQVLASGVGQRDSDGSVIIPLEGLPPFLILKSDGATLYGTRDLSTAKYRIEKLKPDQVLYVIGSEQSLYMQQLFAALKRLRWGENIIWKHVSYGLTRLPQGKMSTRSGELVTAEEILAEAYTRAEQVINQKDGQFKPDKTLIKAVAVGALKWNDLRAARESEVIFNWEHLFSVEGNTGPYIQYSYARTQNILAKADAAEKTGSFDPRVLVHPAELALLRQLVHFPEVVQESAAALAPHLICQFTFELAQNFSRFYESVPVLSSGPAERIARLGLVAAVGSTLGISLKLLGINAPSRL